MSRRFVIIGAGAIGGSLAAELTLAGRDALLIARGEHGRAVAERGLTLRRPTGDVTVPLTVAASPGEVALTSDDILVLAVKTQDAEGVLAEWAWLPVEGGGVAADLPLFTFQNGLVTENLALRRFSNVYGVTIGIAASYLEPGVVVSPSLPPAVGVVAVGRYPSGRDDLQDEVTADLVAAGYVATSTSVIQEWKAFKLLGNIANGLDLFDGDPTERDAVKAELVAEAKAVFIAAGIVWATQEDAVEAGWGGLKILPVPGHRGGKLSTWQSFARGTSSELDYLNGEIVLLGRLHSVPTPVNSAVQRVLGGLSLAPHQEGAAPTAGPLAALREAVAVPASW